MEERLLTPHFKDRNYECKENISIQIKVPRILFPV